MINAGEKLRREKRFTSKIPYDFLAVSEVIDFSLFLRKVFNEIFPPFLKEYGVT